MVNGLELAVAKMNYTGSDIKDIFTSSWEEKRGKDISHQSMRLTLSLMSVQQNINIGIYEMAGKYELS